MALVAHQLSPFSPSSFPSPSFPPKPSISLHLNLHNKSIRTTPFSVSYSTSTTTTLHQNLTQAGAGNDFEEEEEDSVIGDCVVFEEGVFEDPYLEDCVATIQEPTKRKQAERGASVIEPQNLVPERWKTAQDAINITKKERRLIAQQAQFGVRVERRRKMLVPLRSDKSVEEYVAMRNEKLAKLEPVVLDNPKFEELEGKEEEEEEEKVEEVSGGGRVKPKNPKWAVYGRGMEDITEFFNSGDYQPGDAAANQGKTLW